MSNENAVALHARIEGFQKLLEFMPDAMVIADWEGKIAFVNSQTEKLLGYKKEELLNQPIEILVPHRFRQGHAAHRARYMEKPHVRSMGTELDLYARRKDGTEVPVDISLKPIETPEGTLVMSALRDVSERRRAQEELRRAHAELERRVAERTVELQLSNQSLQREVAERKRLEHEIISISEREQQRIGQDLHDSLGQTLTAAAYKAKLIEEQVRDKILPEPDEARKIVKLVSDSISQARNLAKGLYPVDLKEHGLATVLKEFAASITNARTQCLVDSDGCADIPDDAAIQLYRIAQEAAGNALRHGKPKKISISLRTESDGILLTIEDDGTGIQIEPGQRQGMGLHIMRARASLAGGKIRIESSPGEGTLVSCFVPAGVPKEKAKQ